MALQYWILCTLLAVYTAAPMASAQCTPGDVRLLGGDLYYGVVVICNEDGVLGSVCVDGFTDISAIVVCRVLGLTPPPDPLPIISPGIVMDFSVGPEIPLLTTLECEGDETEILQCQHMDAISDPPCEPAGVVCFPPIKPCCVKDCPENFECVDGISVADSTCSCREGFTEVDGNCVECVDDSMCSRGMKCVENMCEPCKTGTPRSGSKKCASKKRSSKKRGSKRRSSKKSGSKEEEEE